MTGGTSGLGAVAADIILRSKNLRLLLGSRGGVVSGAETVSVDLASLVSVRHFSEEVIRRLDGSFIDVLILNAGVNFPTDEKRTIDGFETTFAVNHLAHYLILRRLSPHLAVGARVVVTTSDTHDPKINRLAPPVGVDAMRLARPEPGAERDGPFKRGFRAYSTSKLCNLLMVRTFAARPRTRERMVAAVAYNPGFTPGTGMGRHASLLLRAALVLLVPILRPILRINSVTQAGTELADIALGNVVLPHNRYYASLVRRKLTWPDPSELAQRDDVGNLLWDDSATLVGLEKLDSLSLG
jgi:NAD(P)-dependent dehydrogenase (short-subunit alcohol dehydrogenase family)